MFTPLILPYALMRQRIIEVALGAPHVPSVGMCGIFVDEVPQEVSPRTEGRLGEIARSDRNGASHRTINHCR